MNGLKASILYGPLIDTMISSNQRSCKIKNISSTTPPTIMALLGDIITSKISADCYETSLGSFI